MSELDKGVLKSFQRIQSGLQYTSIRQARTGKRESDGTINRDPTVGLADGKIWIREGEDGNRGQTVAFIVGIRDDIPDLPCLIGENIGGELCAFVPDVNSRSLSVWGSTLAAANNPRTPAEVNTAILEGKNLKMGRVRPSIDNPNTMNIRIEPFPLENGEYWAGGDLDLTSNIPGSSGQRRWVLVYIDKDGAAAAVNGTALTMPNSDGLLEAEIWGISAPLGATPCGAVVLYNTQTTITASNTRFADGRFWLGDRKPKHNYAGTAAPGATDDADDGYSVGSLWFDTTNDNVHGCTDATASAANWEHLNATGGGSSTDYILIREEQGSGVQGGAFTSGSRQVRVLNTEVNDTGGHASIASNQITLAAGTYRARIRCPAFRVDNHQAYLYNVTDAADVLIGQQNYTDSAGDRASNNSEIVGRFTIAGTKVFEVQHECQTTRATNGLGGEAPFATTNIYTIVELEREP